MKNFEVKQTKSGVSFGMYQGETPEDAIAAMMADAGAADAEPDSGLIAEEVTQDARSEAVNQAVDTWLVRYGEESGKDGEPTRRGISTGFIGWLESASSDHDQTITAALAQLTGGPDAVENFGCNMWTSMSDDHDNDDMPEMTVTSGEVEQYLADAKGFFVEVLQEEMERRGL